jgi:serine/threonine-protein kinase
MNEMSHHKQLVHPNILPITAYGLTDKFPSIEVPYMLGGDLATRIQNGTNWAHFKDALGQICQALVYAHRQGVIHGNLKPSNILFNQKGDAYLSDFRLTCLEDYIPYTLSDYSSPEQIRGERLDQRSDVYSLGVLIYVWVTGQKPPQSALTHSEHEYEPLSLRWDVPNISVTMDEVIQQATQYDRANRFSSVKEFYHAFFDALRVDKMFLQMLSSVKSDVTQFSQETKIEGLSGARAKSSSMNAGELLEFWVGIFRQLKMLYVGIGLLILFASVATTLLSLGGESLTEWFSGLFRSYTPTP